MGPLLLMALVPVSPVQRSLAAIVCTLLSKHVCIINEYMIMCIPSLLSSFAERPPDYQTWSVEQVRSEASALLGSKVK